MTPYYCMGACVRHMAALGFYNVWNQPLDFYNSEESIPEYDVLVTNPPYSQEHVDAIFRFAAKSKRPSCLLVPNYTIETKLFERLFKKKKLIFLGPERRYVYRSPPELRPSLRNKQRKYVAPYVTLWVLTALPRVEAPPGCVLCTSRDELPARLRGVAKAAPEALERKAFNEFCRENGLGKLCATWARQGSCADGPPSDDDGAVRRRTSSDDVLGSEFRTFLQCVALLLEALFVLSCEYKRNEVVNRGTGVVMPRVWVQGTFQRPA
ncbi:Pentatricopeptide repeat-containing protein [Durusdinium trenchii]|uniref:Chloroplastic n=1 Tax=Durusdinium trenchii TaxID=1381693 RepID=A0ABP0KTT3_9DINO